jgi:hypothetical protein
MPRMTERWLQQQRSSRILGILLTRCVDCELGGVRERILSAICLQPLGGSTPAHETDLDIPF